MKKITIGIILSIFGLSAPLLAQEAPTQLVDKIIAVADEGVVLQSELDQQIEIYAEGLRAQGTQFTPEDLRRQVLDSLILRRLQLQMAEDRGIRVSDSQLNQSLDRIAQQNGLTLTQLPAALASDGIDYADFRENLREEIILNQLVQREVSRSINVTEKEIQELLGSQAGIDSREYNLGHILIAVSSSASLDDVDKQRQKAQDVLDQLRNGEDFAQLAVAHSNGQNALSGGNLGWRQNSEVPTLFADSVRELDSGGVSDLIRSSSGFHIIKVHEIRGGDKVMLQQYRSRHILLMTNEILNDEQAEQQLADFRQRILDGEDFSEVARTESDDKGSALEGGELGWSTADIFAPAFRDMLISLPVGELSQPFKSQFGWHLVEVLEQREYDATEDAMRNRAINALQRRKLDEGKELWLQRIRDQAYIEIRI